MSPSKDLDAMLKQSSPDVQRYVTALQAENLRLAKQLAKTEAHLTTANSMIEVLKQGKIPNPAHYMSADELIQAYIAGTIEKQSESGL